MKSTYTLLSIYLDGKPLPHNCPLVEIFSDLNSVSDISDEYTLFDYPKCCRKVSGKFLISTNDFSEIKVLINKLWQCHTLIIMLDNNPLSHIANKLFMKRILQITEMIKNEFPEITLILTANPAHILIYKEMNRELLNTENNRD